MSGQSVSVVASIPLVEVTGSYNLSANLAMFSLEGADELLLNITELRFSAVAHFAQTPQGTLEITDVNATIKVYADFLSLTIIYYFFVIIIINT